MIHRVVRGHDKVWGPLWEGFVRDTAGQYIASELRPGAGKVKDPYGIEKDNDGHIQVPPDKWAKVLTRSYINNIILKGTPEAGETIMVQLIGEWLNGPFKTILQSESPAKIVFDELIGETVVFFRLFFRTVNESTDPTIVGYKSNFGVYLWPIAGADYGDATATLVQILRAGADLFPEVYFKHSDYCKEAAKGDKKGDIWMRDKIKGNDSNARRLEYLFDLKRKQIADHPQAAKSGIFPIITTTSQHLDLSKDQDRFPPRIMHNIANIGEKVFNSFHYDKDTARYSFGSYKWTINAMGKIAIDEDSISWDQAIQKHVVNPDEDEEIPQSAFDKTENEAIARAAKFIEGWRYYSGLTLKQVQIYTQGNKTIPPKAASAPNCTNNPFNIPVNLGGGNAPITRSPGTPTINRVKKTPNNSELIQQLPEEKESRQAFLAKTVTPFNNAKIDKKQIIDFASKGYWEQSNLNEINNSIGEGENSGLYVSRFDLWITEVIYGFAAGGPKAISKYYTRHYTQAFGLTPISIKGICANENEYDDLADFIREGQVALSQEPKNVFRLYIPSAKIDCLGAIDTFRGGFVTNNTGIPVAPEFEFGFIIFLDLNDNVQDIGSTARTIIYNFNEDPYWVRTFKNYKNDYIVGQLIDEVNTTSGTGDVGDRRGGTTTPRRPPQTSTPGSTGSNILGPNFTIPANPFQ